MSRRAILTTIALAVIAATGLGIYQFRFSPTAQAEAAAQRLWFAVVAGQADTIAAMIAPEADFTASQVIESNHDFCYGGPCGGDKPRGYVQWINGSSLTGAEVLANSAVWDQAGAPHGRTLAMKRVKGLWLVTRQGASFSF